MAINTKIYFKTIGNIEYLRGQGSYVWLEADVNGIDVSESFTAEQIVNEIDTAELLAEMRIDDVIEYVKSQGYEISDTSED